MTSEQVQPVVANAIARLGVRETARRLGVQAETALRLALPGTRPHAGTIALAEKNLHKLQEGAA